MFRQLPATNYLETCVIVVWLVFYVCMERYDYARLTATALITVSQLSHFPSGIQFAYGLEHSGTNHMDIRIDRKSEVPVRQQVAEQIIFSIATEQVKPGQALPSVRELARRLKIHHNTVSQAYQDLARRTWVVRRKGSRVVVRSEGERAALTNGHDVDDLINATIR